jgi:ABC-type multidrug transport system permease subunit
MIILAYAYATGTALKLTLMFVLAMFLHLTVFSLLGIIVALVVRNHGDHMAVNTFVITPMVFLSGTFYPVDKMPLIPKIIGMLSPLTYSTHLIRGSLLGGGDAALNISVLVCIMVVLFFTARTILNRVEG